MIHLDSGAEERIVNVYGTDISVFSDGSVWNHRRAGKRRFGDTTEKGYKTILVRENGHLHTVFVHRLVGMAFIPNPEGKPQINHINGIKTDNRPENLEWCTNLENRRHRSEILHHYGRRTPVLCVETGIKYESIMAAASELQIARTNIQGCLKGNREKAGGYSWRKLGGD